MKLFIFTCCVILLPWSLCNDPFDNSIKWVPGSGATAIQMQLTPAGREDNEDVFLCRVNQGGIYTPGKLLAINGRIQCGVPYNDLEYKSNTFELLYSHPGTTSWIQYTGKETKNMIIGGTIGGQNRYVCRAYVRRDLIPGMLDPNNKSCRVAGSDGFAYDIAGSVEVLVRNPLGDILGTKMIG